MSENEEEAPRRIAEELRHLKVEDVVVSVLIQISSIGYRRLGFTEETKDDRDLAQTKLAIETMKALTPVLAQVVPAELIRDFEQSVANLQLAYAKAISDVSGQTPGPGLEGQEASNDEASRPPKASAEEAEKDTTRSETLGPESKEGADGNPL